MAIPSESPKHSLQYAKEHVFERVSVARDHEILTEALRHGRGAIGHDALKGRPRGFGGSNWEDCCEDGGQIATR